MSDDQRPITFDEARTDMSKTAVQLTKQFGARRAVSLLAGAATNILEMFLSREEAATYLRRLADEVERDDEPPQESGLPS